MQRLKLGWENLCSDWSASAPVSHRVRSPRAVFQHDVVQPRPFKESPASKRGVLTLSAPSFSGDTGEWWGLDWPPGPSQPSLCIAASTPDSPAPSSGPSLRSCLLDHCLLPARSPRPVPLSQHCNQNVLIPLQFFLIYSRYSNSTQQRKG